MDLYYRNRAAFMAEFQNEPEQDASLLDRLKAEDVLAKVNGLPRGTIGENREKITAHIDIHDKLLYWSVIAWSPGFTGEVIDYGTWPKQRSRHFAMRNVVNTLQRSAPAGTDDLDAAILHGLRRLTDELIQKPYKRIDGGQAWIDRLGVDIGYKDYLVRQLIQVSQHAGKIQPMKGQGIGPENKPISEYRRSRGIQIGWFWWTPPVKKTNQIRHVQYDTNFWKSFVHQRLAVALGGHGCLSFWGGTKDAEQHRYWAEMIVESEYFERTEGRQRVVDVWDLHVRKPDNHAFDNVVACAALASMLGITPDAAMPTEKKQRVKLSDLQKQKRLARAGR
jgi:phage terminase large subunit GpA-like protein